MNKLIIFSSLMLTASYLNAADYPNAAPTTMNVNSDQKLNKDIKDALSAGVFTKGYEQVTVDVRNGNVMLGGMVQTQADKDNVDKKVRDMEGVKAVINRIGVMDRREEAKERIMENRDARRDFRDARMENRDERRDFRDARMENRDMRMENRDVRRDVRMENRDTRRDFRDSRMEYRDDSRMYRDSYGSDEGCPFDRDRTVMNKDNKAIEHKDVKADSKYPQDKFQTPADQELNAKIRSKITGWVWDSYPDVIVHTANGVVTLEGFVATPKDKEDVVNAIQKVEGVKSVKSNLKIGEKDKVVR
jgi:osmotically-inducible protein OsmY